MTTPLDGEIRATQGAALIGCMIGIVVTLIAADGAPDWVPHYLKFIIGFVLILGGAGLGAFIGHWLAEGKSPPPSPELYNPVDSDKL